MSTSSVEGSGALVTQFTVAARAAIQLDGLDRHARARFDEEYALGEEASMKEFVRHLMIVVMLAFGSMAAVTIAKPAVSSADCANGEWWDPKANMCRPPGPVALPCDPGQWWDPTADTCRPLGVGPQPLACDAGQWWDPTANVCRPLGVGPQPLACDNGWWWDPSANVCRPPLIPPG
jgi:hypothetical protein